MGVRVRLCRRCLWLAGLMGVGWGVENGRLINEARRRWDWEGWLL